MEDDLHNAWTDTNEAPPWAPDPALYRALWAGIVAVLLCGALTAVAAVAELAQPKGPGVMPSHLFELTALLPLGFLVLTYLKLAREMASEGLARSALGWFGTYALLTFFEIAVLQGLAPGWQVALWVILLLGMLGVFFVPLVRLPVQKPAAPDAAEAGASKEEVSRKAGLLGGAGVLALIMIKLAGKGLLLKLLALRNIGQWLQNKHTDLETPVYFLLMLFALAYLLWFASAKIRLRDTLGSGAALVGWVELLSLAVMAGLTIAYFSAQNAAMQQAAANQGAVADVSDQWQPLFDVASLSLAVLWSLVTAGWFASLRSRFRPGDEWLDASRDADG